MGTGFRRQVGRLGVTGAMVAASTMLALPYASAEEPPVVSGDCEATVQGKDGKPVAVDVSALVSDPEKLSVGLGSGSGSLLSLPVKDTLDALNLSDSVVGDVAGPTCSAVQGAVNEVAKPAQRLLKAAAPTPPPSEEEPPPPPEDPGDGPEGPGDAPGGGGGDDTAPGNGSGSGSGDADPGSGIGSGTGDPGFTPSPGGTVPVNSLDGFSALPPINIPPAASIPPVAPPVAPDLNQPKANEKQDKRPDVTAKNSGTAEALPAENAPDRLPLLLAVIALVLVVAALARTWLRRKAA